jgi:spermidine/putrescine transport system substrate-binding protein
LNAKKRNLVLLLVASLLLAACSAQPPTPAQPEATLPAAQPTAVEAPATAPPPAAVDPAAEIVVLQWTEYIEPEVYTLFEQETGIRVIEDNISSNEEVLAKLQGGASGYALMFVSDYTVGIMIEQGMIAELDLANIPNLSNLAPRFLDLPYDPDNTYCAAYQWGTTGIGYDPIQVERPESWAVIFNPDPGSAYYGRVTMLDDTREAFSAALIYLGFDINTTVEAELLDARDLLIRAKPGLAGYDSDTFEDLVASGENMMAHGWNGDFLQVQEDNPDLEYTIPQEGGVIWVDNMCVPNNATPEQKLSAEMFIDFVLRPDIGAMISEYNYYASPNQAAEAELGEEFLSDATVYPPQDVLDRLQYIRPVGEAEALYQRLWDEVKSAQ